MSTRRSILATFLLAPFARVFGKGVDPQVAAPPVASRFPVLPIDETLAALRGNVPMAVYYPVRIEQVNRSAKPSRSSEVLTAGGRHPHWRVDFLDDPGEIYRSWLQSGYKGF